MLSKNRQATFSDFISFCLVDKIEVEVGFKSGSISETQKFVGAAHRLVQKEQTINVSAFSCRNLTFDKLLQEPGSFQSQTDQVTTALSYRNFSSRNVADRKLI